MPEDNPAVTLRPIYASRLASFSDDCFDSSSEQQQQQAFVTTGNNATNTNNHHHGGPVVRRRSSLFSARVASSTSCADCVADPTNYNANENNNAQDERYNDDKISDDDCDDNEQKPDLLQLPESTYSLFFTERSMSSLPFLFATLVSTLSFGCLWLSFWNNVTDNGGDEENPLNVPMDVSWTVRVAQYLSIFIAILMEEEIPTGLYLLRVCPCDFGQKFPTIQHSRYTLSAVLRILSGYAFLINVFIILIQADGVVEIFYDVLALQFIQQLDDIVFNLAKIDTLGKRMQRACTSYVFQVSLIKHPDSCKKSDGILKALYFVNLGAFLAGMVVVSTRQANGYYTPMISTVETAAAPLLSVGSVVSGQVTIHERMGKITSEHSALPARDVDSIKLYNSHVTENSIVLVNVADSGGCEPVVYQALPSPGQVDIKVKNFGESACTSDYTLAFSVMN